MDMHPFHSLPGAPEACTIDSGTPVVTLYTPPVLVVVLKPGDCIASAIVAVPMTILDFPSDTTVLEDRVIGEPPTVRVLPSMTAELPSGARVIVCPSSVAMTGVGDVDDGRSVGNMAVVLPGNVVKTMGWPTCERIVEMTGGIVLNIGTVGAGLFTPGSVTVTETLGPGNGSKPPTPAMIDPMSAPGGDWSETGGFDGFGMAAAGGV